MPWILSMQWEDLAFLHWPVAEAEPLQQLLPEGVELDLYQGQAWLGVVPFLMRGVYLRFTPEMEPFPELNVRTYVRYRGRSGVWFFSLDAANGLAVSAARRATLNYYSASMELSWQDGWCCYYSVRHGSLERFVGRYRPLGEPFFSRPGTLDEWLTERYYLFSANRAGQVFQGKISHPRWRLQMGEAEIERMSLLQRLPMRPPSQPPLVHFARCQTVRAWPIVPADWVPERRRFLSAKPRDASTAPGRLPGRAATARAGYRVRS